MAEACKHRGDQWPAALASIHSASEPATALCPAKTQQAAKAPHQLKILILRSHPRHTSFHALPRISLVLRSQNPNASAEGAPNHFASSHFDRQSLLQLTVIFREVAPKLEIPILVDDSNRRTLLVAHDEDIVGRLPGDRVLT